MAKKELFKVASAEVVSAGKASRFNNAIGKINITKELTKAGIDKTAFDSSRWN